MDKEDQPAIKKVSTTKPIQTQAKDHSEQSINHPSKQINESQSLQPKSSIQTTPMTPAVIALMSNADSKVKAGNLESAVATIERALRIEPRNALLIYKLAELRLKQEKPRLAEELAKKSVLLSAKDTELKKRGWLLIAQARKKQGNIHGANEAKKKASEY